MKLTKNFSILNIIILLLLVVVIVKFFGINILKYEIIDGSKKPSFLLKLIYKINCIFPNKEQIEYISKNRKIINGKIIDIPKVDIENKEKLEILFNKYKKSGEPFIITNGACIDSPLWNQYRNVKNNNKVATLLTKDKTQYLLNMCSQLKLTTQHFNYSKAIHLSGNYKTIGLHCDTSYPCGDNIYVMVSGKKQVTLINPNFSHVIPNIYTILMEFRSKESSNELLKYIPYMYRTIIEPGDIIIHNTTMWHEYINLTTYVNSINFRTFNIRSFSPYAIFQSFSNIPTILLSFLKLFQKNTYNFPTSPLKEN